MNICAWQWSSNNISTKHFLHPTFTHGSTLGLYEVLAEKPYICDIITDSVVLCFFIETEKIFSALRSDPVVEDFFWQVWYWWYFSYCFCGMLSSNSHFFACHFLHILAGQ